MLPDMNTPSAHAALEGLLEGNQRFVADKLRRVPLGARLKEVAASQSPFAAVLGCADSRVPAELVFDCSLGDLFVVRNAGHTLSPSVIGSLEYAALMLRVPLILTLGHTRCGAVQAAIAAADGQPAPGSIPALIESIRPALARVAGLPGDLLDNAVRAHIEDTVAALQATPLLGARVAAGELLIVGARYDLDTGVAQVVA